MQRPIATRDQWICSNGTMVRSRTARGFAKGASSLAAMFLLAFLTSVSPAGAAGIVNQGAVPTPPTSKATGKGVDFEYLATPASVRPFTAEELRNAIPAEPPTPADSLDVPSFTRGASTSAATGDFTPASATGFPERIHGKIFFRVGEKIFSCSGTVVDSKNRNVVYTAGHCVYDVEAGRYVDQLAFIPGYTNGATPYEVFYATGVGTTQAWIDRADQSYDLGIVTVEGQVQSKLGSRQLAFDLNPIDREVTIYGYPSRPNPPFDGEILRGCHAEIKGHDQTRSDPRPLGATPCFMQQGSSGGGWVALGNYVMSVVSYGYCDSNPASCGVMFGPVFSQAAKNLYVKTGGSPRPTFRVKNGPPKVVRKRKVSFRFTGTAATLVTFKCKLDRQPIVNCSNRISITRLRPGKHTLRAWIVDQTGKASKKVVRNFRVKLRRR
jgi:hypothetical protein